MRKKIIVRSCYTCMFFYEKDVKCTHDKHRHRHLPKIDCKQYEPRKEDGKWENTGNILSM